MKKCYNDLALEYDNTKKEYDKVKATLYKNCKTLHDEWVAERRDKDLCKEMYSLLGKLDKIKLKMNQAKMREMNR